MAVAGSPEKIRTGRSSSRRRRRRELSQEAPGPRDRPSRSHAPGSNGDDAGGARRRGAGLPGAIIIIIIIHGGGEEGQGPRLEAAAAGGCGGEPLRTLWGRIRGHPSAPHAPGVARQTGLLERSLTRRPPGLVEAPGSCCCCCAAVRCGAPRISSHQHLEQTASFEILKRGAGGGRFGLMGKCPGSHWPRKRQITPQTSPIISC